MRQKILVVEDDVQFRKELTAQLTNLAYECDEADTVDSFNAKLSQYYKDKNKKPLHGILLDVMLANLCSLDCLDNLLDEVYKPAAFIRWIREIPLTVLSKEGSASQRVGAMKIRHRFFLAKQVQDVAGNARAFKGWLDTETQAFKPDSNIVHVGNICCDANRRLCTVRNRRITLTETEFELLSRFIASKGVPLSHVQLEEELPENDHKDVASIVKNHVASLKRKLGSEGIRIEMQYGLGYRFDMD
jgi:DNA-binding response OmpR family regulator